MLARFISPRYVVEMAVLQLFRALPIISDPQGAEAPMNPPASALVFCYHIAVQRFPPRHQSVQRLVF